MNYNAYVFQLEVHAKLVLNFVFLFYFIGVGVWEKWIMIHVLLYRLRL
mgnify:CR=1 FL=1|jgi:hypothetical protein